MCMHAHTYPHMYICIYVYTYEYHIRLYIYWGGGFECIRIFRLILQNALLLFFASVLS